MVVSILGGGHIGTTLAAYLSRLGTCDAVRLFTSRPGEFSRNLVLNDFERDVSYAAQIDLITDCMEEAVEGADIVFITFPHFMIDSVLEEMRAYVKKGCFVGVIPGSGGCEFFWKKYFDSDFVLFGFQRVPFTAKYVTYGKETNLKSWKPSVGVACIPQFRTEEVCSEIGRVCKFHCERVSNFLAVTLTPSNPVLHTSRTYDLYYRATPRTVFAEKGMYYKDWTDHASEILFGIDGELQMLLQRINRIDLSAVRPLGVHYEAPTIELMTKKISGIPTFQSVFTARKEVEGGYVADTDSRYFTEDYPWGLCIIKGFAEIVGVKTPVIDKVLHWYERFMGVEYYEDGRFCGKDLVRTGIPQNYGIHTLEDIYSFYL